MRRFIRSDDYPQVLAIWQTCFGDNESYVRFFWENCLPMCRGLGFEQDNKLVAMLFLLPSALEHECTHLAAEYVYAVATLPECRSKGYAAQLTGWAADIACSEGKSALVLCPATRSLYDYYSKQGFTLAFCKRNTKHGRFAWPPHMLDYIRKEAALVGRDAPDASCENSPHGMLLALDNRAKQWLDATGGQAYLNYTLE